MSSREERRLIRSKRKHYFPTVEALKNAHPNIFDKKQVSVATVAKPIEGRHKDKFVLIEKTLRIGPDREKDFKNLARRVFLQMQESYGSAHSVIECVLSANVILSKTDETGKSTYSLFYGEAYNDPKSNEKDDDYRGSKQKDNPRSVDPLQATQICEFFWCKNVQKFNDKFPENISHNSIYETFDKAINESSEVNIHDIANLVVVFAMIAPSKKIKGLSKLKFGVPKIRNL